MMACLRVRQADAVEHNQRLLESTTPYAYIALYAVYSAATYIHTTHMIQQTGYAGSRCGIYQGLIHNGNATAFQAIRQLNTLIGNHDLIHCHSSGVRILSQQRQAACQGEQQEYSGFVHVSSLR